MSQKNKRLIVSIIAETEPPKMVYIYYPKIIENNFENEFINNDKHDSSSYIYVEPKISEDDNNNEISYIILNKLLFILNLIFIYF